MNGLFQAAESNNLTVDKINAPRFSSAWEFRKRFKDKPLISFTDFTTIAIMQEMGIKQILTRDDHFMHVGMGLQLVP